MKPPILLIRHKSRRFGVPALRLPGILFAVVLTLTTGKADVVNWDGEGDNASWEDPLNWSTDTVPGEEDDVAIDVPGPLTVVFRSGSVTIRSLQCENDLSLLGGDLTLTDGASWVTGSLRLGGGALHVRGPAASFAAEGAVTHTGTHLEVADGGQISLPTLQSLSLSVDADLNLSASDPDSVLELAAVTQGTVAAGRNLELHAFGGGQIRLPQLKTLQGALDAYADGEGTEVDLSGWKGVLGNVTGSRTHLEARAGSTILLAGATAMENVRLVLRETGQIPTTRLTRFTRGEICLDGTSRSLPGLTNLQGSDLALMGGAQLTLAGVTQLTKTNAGGLNLSAADAGSVLSLPNAVAAAVEAGYRLELYAETGGRILLPKLKTLAGAFDLYAGGTGSQVDLSGCSGNLGSGGVAWTYLEAREGGTLIIPGVTSLDHAQLILRGASQIPTAQLIALTHSEVTIDAAVMDLSTLVDSTGTTFTYLNGGTAVFRQAVDLTVSEIRAPTTAVAGQPVAVAWQILNRGSGLTNSVRSDGFFLSADNQPGNDQLLELCESSAAFASGESRWFTNAVTFPADRSGSWYLVVAVNLTGAVFEGTNAFNNTNVSSAPIQVLAPDLIAESVAAQPGTPVLGQPFNLSWIVKNTGTAPARGVWSERVSLVRTNAGAAALPVLLQTSTNDLAAGASLARTQPVPLPDDLTAGTYLARVDLDDADVLPEASEANNHGMSPAFLQVPAFLRLQLPVTSLAEDAVPPTFQALVSRNGELSTALVVHLTNDSAGLLQTPPSVTLGLGLASTVFPVTVQPDGLPKADQAVALTASATGYSPASATVTVRNTDTPRLTLNLDATVLTEGKSVAATIARDLTTSTELVVSLGSPNAGQLLLPASVTLAAGQSSKVFAVIATDDTLVETNRSCVVEAVAPGFLKATAAITVIDNDLPEFRLSLQPVSVSEGAGIEAAIATVSRGSPSARSLSVALANSNPAAVTVPDRVVIPSGQAEVSFPIAAVDNAIVDGPRTAGLQAFALSSTSGERIAASAPVTLTVTDDDGPTLSLSVDCDLLVEGATLAATGTVSRGMATNQALTVTLTSSDPSRVTVPATLLLPAGVASAHFALAAPANATSDGNRPVQITAAATGYTTGSTPVTVSDVYRPDLAVRDVNGPDATESEALINISYRVLNQGSAAAGTNWITRVFLSPDPVAGNDSLLLDYAFTGTLPAGQYFGQTRQIRMPLEPGDYWLVVTTDAGSQIDEVLENNNNTVSAHPIHVVEAYRAVVETDVTQAAAGTPIPLRGTASRTSTGGPMPYALVNLHLHVRGTHRILSALTDALGQFTATFQPLPGEAGSYAIGAAHPGLSDAPIQDHFTLLGMKAAALAPLKVAEQSSLTGQVPIENLGDVPLTGLTVSVVTNLPNLEVTATVGAGTLPGLGTGLVGFALTARDASVPSGTVVLRLRAAEGATLDIPLSVAVESVQPRLVARPPELVAGMKVGGQAIVSFDLVNEGASASAPVQVVVPDVPWLSVASVNPLPSLPAGATNRVTLQLKPAPDLALGPYEGRLAVQAGANTLWVPFTFRALSEARGNLRVTAVDEYTYYAEGAPKVAGATVTVLDAVSELVVTNGLTDTTGQFLAAQLPEGYYEVQVKADNHSPYRDVHLTVAGFETNAVAFLSREAVRYLWTVTPTEIEDRTKITIETVFEAFVPMPVVTIDPPLVDLADCTADITQIDLRITNHGLVAAQKARLAFGTHPDWSFEPLIEELGDLPARSTLVIPLLIRHGGGGGLLSAIAPASIGRHGGGGGCDVSGSLRWELDCGGESHSGSVPIGLMNAAGGCGGGGGGSGGGGLPPPAPGGPGEGWHSFTLSESTSSGGSCDPCVLAILGCILDFIIPEAMDCAKDLLGCSLHARDMLTKEAAYDCAKAALTCAEAAGAELSGVNKAIDAAECIVSLAKACGSSEGGGSTGDQGGNLSQAPLRHGIARAGIGRQGPLTSVVERAELTLVRQRADWIMAEIGPMRHFFGNDAWFGPPDPVPLTNWLDAFSERIDPSSEQGILIAESEAAELRAVELPTSVTAETEQMFLERWNRSVAYWEAGVFFQNQVPPGQNPDFLAMDTLREVSYAAVDAQAQYAAAGFSSSSAAYRQAYADFVQFLSEGDNGGVCAQVRIRLEQELVSTRDAFHATLEIQNALPDPLEEIAVELVIRRRNGEDASAVFAVFPPTLSVLTAADGQGVLGGNATGKAEWLLVPTTVAALDGPEQFLIGGVLRYRQGSLQLTVPLAPATVTVFPSPSLKLKYYHERSVFADDPFTLEIEPSVPFSLAVMVENKGRGEARDVRIASAQPKIVENEKGLLVDFKIIATEVAGQNLEPSLTVDFGLIPPGTNAIGRWLLTSTLLGGFLEYQATVEHQNGLGEKKLSLVEGVEIHELIHIVRALGARDDGRPDFLANDVADLYDRPDTLHLSDGSVEPVQFISQALVDGEPDPDQLEIGLSATLPAGWVYLRLPNPGGKAFQLVRVVRSDGLEIPLGENAWTTDRTFLGNAQRPIEEDVLHLFDYNSTGRYTLVYAEAPEGDIVPPTSQVAALPAESGALIPVSWSGQDNPNGSGIVAFDVWVSVDSEEFTPWLEETLDQSALYPAMLGKHYAFYSLAIDRAGNREDSPAMPDAQTSVTRTNHPPTLEAIGDRTVREGETLDVQPVARDPDGDTLVFSLNTGAPPGAAIDPSSGRIRWSTGEGSGPNQYLLTVQVLDNGAPRLGTTRGFRVTVTDDNAPPVLDPIANRTIAEGFLLRITNHVSDPDLPRQTFTFRLGPGAPAGATVDPVSGTFSWQPNELQGGTTNRMSLMVSDSGSPSLSATQTFSLVVLDTRSDFTVGIGTTHVLAGQKGAAPLVLTSGADLAQFNWILQAADAHLLNFELVPGTDEVAVASLDPLGQGTYWVQVVLDPSRARTGERVLAQITFDTLASSPSAVVPLTVLGLQGSRLSGEPYLNVGARPGRLYLVGNEPLLDASIDSPATVQLVVYGKAGNTYHLQRTPTLGPGAVWSLDQTFQLPGTAGELERPLGAEGAVFFRVIGD